MLNPINFFEGILNLLSTIGNSFKGFIAIFQSIFNLIGSVISTLSTFFNSIYQFTPFITVPISVIAVLLIVNFVLSIIKKLPLA